MSKVLNRYKDALTITADDVYIGRGSPWGNPYKIGIDGNRDDVCDLFELFILNALDLEPLRGRNLVCYCAPQRCHGDSILKRLAETENGLG